MPFDQTKIKLSDRLEIRTKDPDLGTTLCLWLAQDLTDFLYQNSKKIVIRDGGSNFKVSLKGDSLILHCPQSLLKINISLLPQLAQKIRRRLGQTRSPFVMSQQAIVSRYREYDKILKKGLKLPSKPQPCRFLLRVDDFPSVSRESSEFLRFHDLAHENNLPYLLAVTPFLDQGKGPVPLSDPEIKILRQCVGQGATLALHGFTHKSRYAAYKSELVSMPATELEENIHKALSYFHSLQLPVNGFVAPFNTYDPQTLPVIAKHFSFFCGGPESVLSLGFRTGPSFYKQCLYIPSYNGVYDLSENQFSVLDELMQKAHGFLLPITLHWANEIPKKLRDFRFLCARLKPSIMPWDNFLIWPAQLKQCIKP